MEKKLVTTTVFRKTNDHNPIKFGEINIELKPDDVIISGHDEGFYSENNSWDAHYFLEVNRDRLETDDEFATRCQNDELNKVWSRERRYESYLKLKKEFES
jgi:hypothetical protein